jgi:5-methylcytosine-specific restriction endonuclease McrA
MVQSGQVEICRIDGTCPPEWKRQFLVREQKRKKSPQTPATIGPFKPNPHKSKSSERLPPPKPHTPRWYKYHEQNGICHYCLEKIDPTEWTIDHKKPRLHGGIGHPENTVGCCWTCNHEKGSQTYEAFMVSEYLKRKRAQATKKRNS